MSASRQTRRHYAVYWTQTIRYKFCKYIIRNKNVEASNPIFISHFIDNFKGITSCRCGYI